MLVGVPSDIRLQRQGILYINRLMISLLLLLGFSDRLYDMVPARWQRHDPTNTHLPHKAKRMPSGCSVAAT